MIIRTIGLSLFAAAAMTPALAQDVPASSKAGQKQILDNTVKPCPDAANAGLLDDTVKPAAKPGGKVSVKDMTGPMVARTGSGQGTGKVNVQDIHRTAPAGGGKATIQDSTKCAVVKP